MAKTLIGAIALVIVGFHPAAALTVTEKLEVCTALKEADLRLKCFEIVVNEQKEPQGATTKEVLAPAPPKTYKVVDPDDIYVSPRKFEGQGVEVRGMSCFHADKDEFRCVTLRGLTVAVFAKAIIPVTAQTQIESDCGTLKAMSSKAVCRKTVRITVDKFGFDNPNPTSKRMVISTDTIEIVAPPSRKKR